MSTQDNKALVQRFYEEVINQKNLAALDQFVSPTAVNHTVPSGLPQGPSQFLSMHLTAFPDVKATVVDLLADGDKVVALVSIHGTHQGAFRGMARWWSIGVWLTGSVRSSNWALSLHQDRCANALCVWVQCYFLVDCQS